MVTAERALILPYHLLVHRARFDDTPLHEDRRGEVVQRCDGARMIGPICASPERERTTRELLGFLALPAVVEIRSQRRQRPVEPEVIRVIQLFADRKARTEQTFRLEEI